MLIKYRGELVEVEVIDVDQTDPEMFYLVWFPEGHHLRCEEGVWLDTKDLEVIER